MPCSQIGYSARRTKFACLFKELNYDAEDATKIKQSLKGGNSNEKRIVFCKTRLVTKLDIALPNNE